MCLPYQLATLRWTWRSEMIQKGKYDCETGQFWAWVEFVVRRQCSSGNDKDMQRMSGSDHPLRVVSNSAPVGPTFGCNGEDMQRMSGSDHPLRVVFELRAVSDRHLAAH